MASDGQRPVVVWFRQDLRLADNPALAEAAASGRPVVALYVLDDDDPWAPGAAARWWLHGSLAALRQGLDGLGCPLVLRRGPALRIVPEVVEQAGAGTILWNRCYEPHAIARDKALKAAFGEQGIEARSFNGSLLFEPWEVMTKGGTPYRVFTPYWRACLGVAPPRRPLRAPKELQGLRTTLQGDVLEAWGLLPKRPDWAGGLRDTWRAGETAALSLFQSFLSNEIQGYKNTRDFPCRSATSALSPHLHIGAVSPNTLWHGVIAAGGRPDVTDGPGTFLKELVWREFSHHLLFHVPTLPEANLDRAFDAMPWRVDPAGLDAWRRGLTGYPIVDAGMRQLWHTGWMHNRVRMVVASFLTKHLLVDWREGARWFWDTLVDADLANNSASWQWVAGCGADAAPFFRIFNPTAQGERFDPEGGYVRRWVPELARLPDKVLHKPWTASADVLAKAGVTLGTDYPEPVVDHGAARARALETWRTHIRKSDE